MKTIFSVLLLFSLFSFTSPVLAFEDIDTSPYKEAIEYLEESGVVEGYSDDSFRPYDEINRAEFTKIVMEQLYPGESNGNNCFLDVQYDWYAEYICEAESRGIVSGYPDGNFHPELEINLVEALSVIFNAYEIETYDYLEWYERYYWTASSLNLLEPVNSEAFEFISRGEMAQLIYNVLSYLGEVDELPPDEDYEIYETTNEAFEITWLDPGQELETTIMAVEKEHVTVLVPEGYEELGKAHVNDLLYCDTLLSGFFGFDFPHDRIISKIYISGDGSTKGSSVSGKILHRYLQESIDHNLEDVLTNDADGFLYHSSPDYCANSHELTHAFFSEAPLPSWFNEGLAEFTQKYNQGEVKDGISCAEYGYYNYDDYSVYPNLLEEDLDYHAAMCAVEELLGDPESGSFKNLMNALYAFIENPELESAYRDIIPDEQERVYGTTSLVFSTVLIEVLGPFISLDLIKYGIDLEAMNLL